jgi:endonuclease G, mitochondrial
MIPLKMWNARTRFLCPLIIIAFAASIALGQNSLEFGDPGCDGDLHDREFADRKFFQLCHSYDLKVPLWVGYKLTKADLKPKSEKAERPAIKFKQDTQLKHPGATDDDYIGSGYSRGHMAPADDFSRSETAIKSTFILSNVVPQFQQVNGGKWAQLELMVRNLVRDTGTAYVFTGPIFENDDVETIGDGEVGVPTETFKVLMVIGPGTKKKMFAVVMPNSDNVTGTVNSFVTTVRAVEDQTGFDFFSALSKDERDRLETAKEEFPASTTKKHKPEKNNKK